MTHQIAKLPLRVYTPIPDLEYNTLVEDDIKELEHMLNIDVGSMRSLSPVSCQAHEPHESLRTVPWVKTPRVEGIVEIDPNISLYQNGLWVNAVPQFETLADTEDEIEDLIADPITTNDLLIDTAVDDTETARDNIVVIKDATKVTGAEVYEKMIKSRQYISHDRVLYGVDTCVVNPGKGYFDPVNNPPHSIVNFVTDGEQGYTTENPTVPWGSPVYRTYNHPQWFLGGAYDEQDWAEKPHPTFILDELSYRSRWSKWEYLRPYWQEKLSKIAGLPSVQDRHRRWVSPFTLYPAFALADLGWVHFARHFGFASAPAIIINITSDILESEEWHGAPGEDPGDPYASDPSNWIRPYIWVWEEDPADGDGILGFYIWFENYRYSPGGVSNRKRTITYTWAAYGQRIIPGDIWT